MKTAQAAPPEQVLAYKSDDGELFVDQDRCIARNDKLALRSRVAVFMNDPEGLQWAQDDRDRNVVQTIISRWEAYKGKP